MRKLLIAEGSEELRHALAQFLDGEFTVQTCADGETAQRLLHDFLPDLVVLDLMLPGIDGITLLRRIAQSNIRPVVLVTLAYQSPFILAALEKYGVAYAVSKPCDADALAGQIRFLAEATAPEDAIAPEPALTLPSILLQLGLKPKLDGYKQLLLAIPRYLEDPAQNLTKELYDFVGHAVDKTALAAERSMRHAIQSAWSRADMSIWRQYFPAAPDGTVPKPTVGSFIAHIAAVLESHQVYQKRA
jgi:DNA-binding response OmpR family regulator